MSGQWFYATDAGQAGPVDAPELHRLAAEGALRPTNLVWREGLPEWIAASTVPGLFPSGETAAAAMGGPAPTPAQAPAFAQLAGVLPYQGGGVPVGVSATTMDVLRRTRPWVLFLSILGFIGTGLMLIAAIVITAATTIASSRSGIGPPAWIGLVYVVMALFCFVPAVLLWRYGSRIGTLSARGHVEDLERALDAQRVFWRLTGIFVITGIVLYFAAIALMIVLIRM